mmetsp:Transcript_31552/g.61996  ORF Transcript_31552/g.61996 Transcript_31552/m.61996 type:complete len:211 (+) Transcript_31552:234-866(+)
MSSSDGIQCANGRSTTTKNLSSPAALVTGSLCGKGTLQLRSARTHKSIRHNFINCSIQLLDSLFINQVHLPLCFHAENTDNTLNLRRLLSDETAAARCGRTVIARRVLTFWLFISACNQVLSHERLYWYNRTAAQFAVPNGNTRGSPSDVACGAPRHIAKNARPPVSAPGFRIRFVLLREFERHKLLLPKIFLVTFLIPTPAGATKPQTP